MCIKNLKYYYGVMGSGKSAKILKLKETYEKENKIVLLLKPEIDTRDVNIIKSRNGLWAPCITFSKEDNLMDIYKKYNPDVIMVDEANFCTIDQVKELKDLSKVIKVICFGVMINYVGQVFEASKEFIQVGANIIEVPFACECGKKAKINAYIVDGKIQYTGSGTAIGNLGEYKPMCLSCWEKQRNR